MFKRLRRHPRSAAVIDFLRHDKQLPGFMTFSRPDATPCATRRRVYGSIGPSRTNLIPNSSAVGAVAGSPGTQPTGWTSWAGAAVNGIAREIVGIGIEAGVPYVDVRFFGTSTITGTWGNANFVTTNAIAAAAGQTHIASMFMRHVAGALPPQLNLRFNPRDAANVTVTTVDSLITLIPGEPLKRFQAPLLLPANTAFNTFGLRVGVTNGVAYDFTLRVGAPQLEVELSPGSGATAWIPTTSGAVTTTEWPRTNLLKRSQDFGGAGWTRSRAAVRSSVAAAPDGSWTADLLTEDSTSGNHYVTQSAPCPGLSTLTWSVYVKSVGAARSVRLRMSDNVSYLGNCVFNPDTGAYLPGDVPTILPLPDGWYRISIKATTGAGSTTAALALWLYKQPNTSDYVGDGTSGLLVWGAQLEYGDSTTPYIPTLDAPVTAITAPYGDIETLAANEPRIEYNADNTPRGLLVEPSRTNAFTNNNTFTGGSWPKSRVTVQGNAALAPDGTLTADKIVEDTTANNTHSLSRNMPFAAGDVMVMSVFAKAAERNVLCFNVPDADFGSPSHAIFNLSTGESSIQGGAGGMIPYPDGWYRCWWSITALTSNTSGFSYHLCSGFGSSFNLATYTGDGVSGLYLWQAQLENDSLTSIIPTTAARTRAAESCTVQNISDINWNANGWSCMVEWEQGDFPAGVGGTPITISNGNSTQNYIRVFVSQTGQVTVLVNYGGVITSKAVGGVTVGSINKLAFALRGSGWIASLNGATPVSFDATIPMATCTSATLGTSQNSTPVHYLSGYLRRVKGWNYVMGGGELQRESA